MPDIDIKTLPLRFKMIINNITCIGWPLEEAAEKVFWLQLERALKDGLDDTIMDETVV